MNRSYTIQYDCFKDGYEQPFGWLGLSNPSGESVRKLERFDSGRC